MKKKTEKIIDGRYQIGLVTDWIMRDKQISSQAMTLYLTIAFYSLNVYHKRMVNISKEALPFKDKTLFKYRDELVERGFIEWKNTKAYSAFKLKEPMGMLRKFKFKGDEGKMESEIKTPDDDEPIDF